jgi:hypothetical protein
MKELKYFSCSNSNPFEIPPLHPVDIRLHQGFVPEPDRAHVDELFVNALGATQFLVHDTRIIVSDKLAEELRLYWACDFLGINNVFSFRYKMDRARPRWHAFVRGNPDETAREVVTRVIDHCSVERSSEKYFVVDVKAVKSVAGKCKKLKSKPTDGSNCPVEHPLVNMHLLERDGVLLSWGFLCKPNAFALFQRELLTPYTWYASVYV